MAQSAGQEGFEYEKKAYAALGKYKISTGGVAGASHDKADLSLKTRSGKTAGCELKTTPTAAGSLVLKYFNGKWSYGDRKGEPEKEFIFAIGEKFHLLQELNKSGPYGKHWRGKTPHLQNDAKNPRTKLLVGARNAQAAYDKDIKLFGAQNEVRIIIPAQYISAYYITKKSSYLNVGTHGFYTLNGKDSLGLQPHLQKNKMPPIPDFSRSATAMIRVRVQYKGGGDYQFVAAFAFSITKSSPYNIAPLVRGSKSDVDTRALAANPILMAFT